jgi:hypothetical protein
MPPAGASGSGIARRRTRLQVFQWGAPTPTRRAWSASHRVGRRQRGRPGRAGFTPCDHAWSHVLRGSSYAFEVLKGITRREAAGHTVLDVIVRPPRELQHVCCLVFFICGGVRAPAVPIATRPAIARSRRGIPSVPAMTAASAPIAAINRCTLCRTPIEGSVSPARSYERTITATYSCSREVSHRCRSARLQVIRITRSGFPS